ncbi:MAG TPA: HEAT repeat domain-containing protein [Candidatus Competibacter sp.]|nr:HEAT repeat domain-containing protein [Candidatus Competibacteraceae bacterium]HPE70934.1 HEAT repeat domain-containing protein [Candidatus Competibacter sp.]HRW64462.1 HEAT repeat domain-containing protein [Candidatus Competibacter sp.]
MTYGNLDELFDADSATWNGFWAHGLFTLQHEEWIWLQLCRAQLHDIARAANTLWRQPSAQARLENGLRLTKKALCRFPQEAEDLPRRVQGSLALLAWLGEKGDRFTIDFFGQPDSQQTLNTLANETGLPVNLLRDMAGRLWCAHEQPDSPCACHRPPVASLKTWVLLVLNRLEGIPARLTVDLIPNGQGALYRHPNQMHMALADDFRDGLDRARQYLEAAELWSSKYDYRWQLQPADGSILSNLAGLSASAQFALALAGLGVQAGVVSGPDWARHLHEIDWPTTAVSAELNPDGSLKGVKQLWEKTGFAAIDLANRGLLTGVGVTAGQGGIPDEYKAAAGPLAAPIAFPVIEADRLETLVGRLAEAEGPRHRVREQAELDAVFRFLTGSPADWARHYQVLPLLRELSAKDLPNARPGEDEDEERGRGKVRDQGIPVWELIRWEEFIQNRDWRVDRTPVAVAEVFEDFRRYGQGQAIPRFFVLGPPGSGKTTLTRWLIREALEGRLTRPGDGGPWLPVFVRLLDWQRTKAQNLEDFLVAHCQSARIDRQTWERWLERGELLLLLDGLDEVDQPFVKDILSPALQRLRRLACAVVLTCRTVSFEAHRALTVLTEGQWPVFVLDGLKRDHWAAYIRAYPASEGFQPEALIEHLDNTPAMTVVAATPLLLDMLCFALDDPKSKTPVFPLYRAALYERVIEKFLDRSIAPVVYPNTEPQPYQKRRWLEQLSLQLFEAGYRQQLADARDLGERLEALLEGRVRFCADTASALLTEWTRKGILRQDEKGRYFFFHRTIHEYLVACALCQHQDMERLIEQNWYKPSWREVMLLAAGYQGFHKGSDEASDFVNLVWRQNWGSNDLLHYSFRLAFSCLGETVLKPDMVTALWEKWDRLVWDCVYLRGPLLKLLVPAIPREGIPEVVWRRLQNKLRGRENRLSAIQTLIPVTIRRWLQDSLWYIRGIRLEPVGAGLAPEITSVRDELLAIWILEALRTASVVSELVAALQHDHKIVRWAAAEALGMLGSMAASAVPDLTDALKDNEIDLPLSSLSASAFESRFFGLDVSEAAARALGKLGPVAVPAIPSLGAVVSRDSDIWWDKKRRRRGETAKEAISKINLQRSVWDQYDDALKIMKRPELLSEFNSKYDSTSQTEVELPRDFGHVTASAIPFLQETLHSGEWGMRPLAAQTLGDLGEAAAPAVMDLQAALQDENDEVRAAAAEALGKIGVLATPVVPSLEKVLLGDKVGKVRRAAAEALGQLGTVASLRAAFIWMWTVHQGDVVMVLRELGAKATPAIPDLRATFLYIHSRKYFLVLSFIALWDLFQPERPLRWRRWMIANWITRRETALALEQIELSTAEQPLQPSKSPTQQPLRQRQ